MAVRIAAAGIGGAPLASYQMDIWHSSSRKRSWSASVRLLLRLRVISSFLTLAGERLSSDAAPLCMMRGRMPRNLTRVECHSETPSPLALHDHGYLLPPITPQNSS